MDGVIAKRPKATNRDKHPLAAGGDRRRRYDETWDWFLQNVRLKDALEERGYDVNYSWSIGRHGLKAGGVVLPEMMRWLWRDQPASTDVNDRGERSFNEPAGDEAAGEEAAG